jgi:hypothetical protein
MKCVLRKLYRGAAEGAEEHRVYVGVRLRASD